MSNSDNSGCFAILIFIAYAAAWVISGTLAWNSINPESFGGAIGFLILWAIFGYLAQSFAMIVIAFLAKLME